VPSIYQVLSENMVSGGTPGQLRVWVQAPSPPE
jgi:hypothetical protein